LGGYIDELSLAGICFPEGLGCGLVVFGSKLQATHDDLARFSAI